MPGHAVLDDACGLRNQWRAFRPQHAVTFFVIDALNAFDANTINIHVDIDLELFIFIRQGRQHWRFQPEGFEAPGRKRGYRRARHS